jgi:hypothetical protein
LGLRHGELRPGPWHRKFVRAGVVRRDDELDRRNGLRAREQKHGRAFGLLRRQWRMAKTTEAPSEPSGRGIEPSRSVELRPRRKDKLSGKHILQTHKCRGSRRIGRGIAVAGRRCGRVRERGARAPRGRREVVAPMGSSACARPRSVRSGQAPVWLDVLLASTRASDGKKKKPQMLDESEGMDPNRWRLAARMCK